MRNLFITATLAAVVATGAQAAGNGACAADGALTFAVVPAENATGVIERFTPTAAYLTEQLGTPVTLRVASDYAAVIEGQKARNIHIAWYGPASFSRAYQLTEGNVVPFAAIQNRGVVGYYAVIVVNAASPFQTLEDLRGKTIGFVDPNSTSGNYAPRFFLDRDHQIIPEDFFSNVVFTGSHENAIIALKQGTVDAATNWWDNPYSSNLRSMEAKGMINYDDFRIVWTSPIIVGSPMAYLANLSEGCRAAIRTAFYEMDTRAADVWGLFNNNQGEGFVPIDIEAYRDTMAMLAYVDEMRKRQ
jgi:phosphonate transport system substrate-binding protein